MLRIRTYRDSGPPGRLAADCRRYTRFVQRYTQCSGDDSSPSSPGEGLAPWDIRIRTYHDSGPAGRLAAGCRRYTRYVQRYTQCSGADSSPSSPGEGLAPLDVTDTNVPRFRPCGRVAADCRRYSGCTMFWVIPFNPTGCNCHPYIKFVTNTVYLTLLSLLCVRKIHLFKGAFP